MFEEDRCKNLSNECEGKMLLDFFLIYKIDIVVVVLY